MRQGVRIPTEKRIKEYSANLNVTRRNHGIAQEFYGVHSSSKEDPEDKWVPDIEKIKELFEECFGTTMADLRRETTYSKLAQCDIQEDEIGWVKMMNYRPKLNDYIEDALITKELYENPDPSEPGQDAADAPESHSRDNPDDSSDHADSDRGQGAHDDSDTGSSDDDIPLVQLKKRGGSKAAKGAAPAVPGAIALNSADLLSYGVLVCRRRQFRFR